MREISFRLVKDEAELLGSRLADPITGHWIDAKIPLRHANLTLALKVGESVDVTAQVLDAEGRPQLVPDGNGDIWEEPVRLRRIG